MLDYSSLLAAFEPRIRAAQTVTELGAIEQDIMGRKNGALTVAMKSLKDASQEERVKLGQEFNQWKKRLTEALDQQRNELASAARGSLATEDRLDVTLELPPKETGHLHLIPEFIRQVEEVFGRMGFEVAEGPEIETEENNFNLLNVPASHPARDAQDTFWITQDKSETDPNKRFVLRTHTSPVQVRYMQTHKPPFRIICPGKVYRKDSDATHSPMFHQFEGLVVGKDISLAHLKGVLITAMRALMERDVEFRFRTGFFPFVEPGLEMDMMWQGNLEESREGRWLEMGGCGMVHPNVFKNCGIDPEEWQGFAFGFGVERPLMIKYQIPDLRSFYTGDLRFLRQF